MAETTATNATTQAAENAATEQHSADAAAAEKAGNAEGASDSKAPDIEALIQRAVDRATNKLGNENKRLRGEIETLRKASMTDAELRKLEIEDREKELAERAKALTDKENRLFAMRAIKEAGLDDGGQDAMEIIDFVMADSEDAIRERVKSLNALITRLVKTQVDAVFKANGRTPGVGSDSAANAGGANESIAVQMAQRTAQANKAAQSVLDHYTRRGR